MIWNVISLYRSKNPLDPGRKEIQTKEKKMEFIVDPIKMIVNDPDRDCYGIYLCNCNSKNDCKAKESCLGDDVGVV